MRKRAIPLGGCYHRVLCSPPPQHCSSYYCVKIWWGFSCPLSFKIWKTSSYSDITQQAMISNLSQGSQKNPNNCDDQRYEKALVLYLDKLSRSTGTQRKSFVTGIKSLPLPMRKHTLNVMFTSLYFLRM